MRPALSSWGFISRRARHGPYHLVKKAQQQLFLLRKLKKKSHPLQQHLVNLYHCAMESILAYCATVFYVSYTFSSQEDLQVVLKTAQHIIGTELLDLGLHKVYTGASTGRLVVLLGIEPTWSQPVLSFYHWADVRLCSDCQPRSIF